MDDLDGYLRLAMGKGTKLAVATFLFLRLIGSAIFGFVSPWVVKLLYFIVRVFAFSVAAVPIPAQDMAVFLEIRTTPVAVVVVAETALPLVQFLI